MIFKFFASEMDSAFAKIKGYVKPGASYVIEVQKAKEKRSLPQNKYYFGVIVTLIAQSTGYTKEEMHQELGKMFLRYEKNGKEFVQSTTKLNTLEAEKYYEQCRQWALEELGIMIPLPNQISQEMYMTIKNIYTY